ncbi:MAG: hypothetical protein E5299_01957 [Burkholderia gladioli]|nr:MAG: hypothetical protein E5299_01957 [Burkholderia gladioli]
MIHLRLPYPFRATLFGTLEPVKSEQTKDYLTPFK